MTNLTKSADKFCNKPGMLTPYVSTDDDIQLAEKLRSYICDTINMNVTALLQEISHAQGFTRVIDAFEVNNKQ